jgi:hypothetical protein
MSITIYGASDDLVEVDGAVGASPEEYNVYGNGKSSLMWHADFIAPDPADESPAGRIRVHAIYDGCWHFSVGQADEVYQLPAWPVTITQAPAIGGGPGYSALLTIDAPEGTRIANVQPDDDQ